MMAAGPMFTLAPNCEYYIATDSQTQEVIAVIEAGDELVGPEKLPEPSAHAGLA
jgi:hypothetical protein